MAKKPLRSQLNQIRAWVRQGRTDAWIAHQLDISASELREFRRRHELSAEEEDTGEVELRDEIEAEIEALSEVAAEEEEEAAEDEAEDEAEEGDEKREGEGSGRRRRRRRRRGRGGGGGGGDRAGTSMQATFDHGDTDGYGLWLDPSVSEDPVYTEHWAGHRKVEVTIEADRIVVRRV
jgi:hypothetical protein